MPRRGNREGTFRWEPATERRKYGRWTGRLLITGVGRIPISGRKNESKASVRERLHAKRDGYRDVTRPTRGSLAEWCDVWLRLYVKGKAPRTVDYYGDMLGHLLPHLGSEPLGGISPDALLLALEKIERPATRRKAYEVLRIALNRAVRTGRIRANVCALVDPPAYEPREVEPPTADEIAAITGAIHGQRDEALILAALGSGLRSGELCGLRWGDLEDGGIVRVRGQLTRQRVYVPRPKRGSQRVAVLPPVALAAIDAHRQRQALALGRLPEPFDYVFLDAHGRPMTGYEAHRRWEVALRAAGVRDMPMHATRHYAHSKMAESGMDGSMIDALFGHLDPRMRDTYTHATEEARRLASDVMQRALGG